MENDKPKRAKEENQMKKFFAVYDLELGGFKARMTGTDPEAMIDMMIKHIYNTIDEDRKYRYEDSSDIEIIDSFELTFCEVSEEDAEIIENSDDYGFLATVKGVDVTKYKNKILPIRKVANAYQL